MAQPPAPPLKFQTPQTLLFETREYLDRVLGLKLLFLYSGNLDTEHVWYCKGRGLFII